MRSGSRPSTTTSGSTATYHSLCNAGSCWEIEATCPPFQHPSHGSQSEDESTSPYGRGRDAESARTVQSSLRFTDFDMAEHQTNKAGPTSSAVVQIPEAWHKTELARH